MPKSEGEKSDINKAIAFTLCLIAKAIMISRADNNVIYNLFNKISFKSEGINWNLRLIKEFGDIGYNGNLGRQKLKLEKFLNTIRSGIPLSEEFIVIADMYWKNAKNILNYLKGIHYVHYRCVIF